MLSEHFNIESDWGNWWLSYTLKKTWETLYYIKLKEMFSWWFHHDQDQLQEALYFFAWKTTRFISSKLVFYIFLSVVQIIWNQNLKKRELFTWLYSLSYCVKSSAWPPCLLTYLAHSKKNQLFWSLGANLSFPKKKLNLKVIFENNSASQKHFIQTIGSVHPFAILYPHILPMQCYLVLFTSSSYL